MQIEAVWGADSKCGIVVLPQIDEREVLKLFRVWDVPDYLLQYTALKFIFSANMIMVNGICVRQKVLNSIVSFEIYLPAVSYHGNPDLLNLIAIHELRHARNALKSVGNFSGTIALSGYGTEEDCRNAEEKYKGFKLVRSYQLCFEFMIEVMKHRK